MFTELLSLASALSSGGYALYATIERCFVYTKGHGLILSSPPPSWSIVIAVLVSLIARQKHHTRKMMRIHNCQPAPSYPHSDPLLGIDWTMTLMRKAQANETLQWFHGLYTEVGNTHWNNNLGTWNLTTNEPENVKAILATQFESWPIASLRLRFGLLALGPHAIFSTNGHEWQEARAMIRPSFVRNQIADFECIEKHMCNFLARLPSDGSKIDLQDLLYDFTMDTSTDFMFGYSTNTLVKPSPEALEFIESFTYSLFTAANRGRAGWVAFWLPNKKLNDAVWKCKRFIDHYMEEALAEGKPKASYVFMNQMVESGASHEYIRDQLLAMILGGRDTTASTLSALFWTLARRPDVVEKLRAEITKELGDEAPTWETLKNMSYLNMVLKEALRLWPPVASNFRCANKDVVLPKGGGPDGQSPVFVPKGSGCRWVTWSMHRRKDLYEEDAEEFRPERWETLRTSWEYVPFSGGPRICIGQQFAWTMMSYLVARVFQTFRAIEARDDREMAIKLGVTTSLPNGCWVSLASVTTEATPCHVVQT